MNVVLFYPDCPDFKKHQDGFWIQCPSSEVNEKIVPSLTKEDKSRLIEADEHYLSTSWATTNPNLLVKPDSYYFLVSRDAMEVLLTDPFYPYASQWNGLEHLREIKQIKINSIQELRVIKEEPVMNKPFQRKNAENNALVGSNFEKAIQKYFEEKDGHSYEVNFVLPIGLKTKKKHKFDLGFSDGNNKIVIECKSHKWTETGKIPSAKMTVWNEAMFYFHLIQGKAEKRMVVLKDYSEKRKMTLAQYYIRLHGYLIPDDVDFYEYDEGSGEMVKLAKN